MNFQVLRTVAEVVSHIGPLLAECTEVEGIPELTRIMPPRRRAAEAAAEQPSAIQRTDNETGEPQDLGTARAQAAQRVARRRDIGMGCS